MVESQSAADVVRLNAEFADVLRAGAVFGRSAGSPEDCTACGEEEDPGRKGARPGVGVG